MEEKELQKQVDKILKKAKSKGLESNFFFTTTLDRYLTQLKVMEDLKASIEAEGTMVTKEYVKGRKNLYVNPALATYNNTCKIANNTVQTLAKIVSSFDSEASEKTTSDPMMDFLREQP